MSTSSVWMPPEEIPGFISDTLSDYSQCVYGIEGEAEYGVTPFVAFYIWHLEDDFLRVCHEVIELYQEFQTLIDEPFKKAYFSKTQKWKKATPENLGRELLRNHAKFCDDDGFKCLFIEATSEEVVGNSAAWAITAIIDRKGGVRYSYVKMTFRDRWYRANNKERWHAFVEKWIARLQPEHCYSGYEITSMPGYCGSYETDTMNRICADHFYGLDIDNYLWTSFCHHYYRDYHPPGELGAGLRTPTWCFLLAPFWRSKLGMSVIEVKKALAHPDITIKEIPYTAVYPPPYEDDHPTSTPLFDPKGSPALWVQLGNLDLHPVDKGVPEILRMASKLIRPIRANLLELRSLDTWEDDPNPRFNGETMPQWMARFDDDSEWPDKKRRFVQQKPDRSLRRCEADNPCPTEGWWTSLAAPDRIGRRYFKQGEIMPNFPHSTWGATIWYLENTRDEGQKK